MTDPLTLTIADDRTVRRSVGSRTRSTRLEQMVCTPGEDEETRRRKIQFTIASVLVTPAGLVWGALYFAYGAPAVAAIPVAYSVLTLLDLLLLTSLRRFELFRQTQQILILVLPAALQLALGGFVTSSLVILWSFLAVLMAVLFGGVREARWWFIAYLSAIVLVALVQPRLAIRGVLPDWLVLAFFVLNIVTVSSVAFVVLYSFVADRRMLRALEVAYLKQDLALRQSEKLATLGTLAAGIAHELNNPAAATRRAAEQLREAFARLEEVDRQLEASTLPPAARALLQSLEQQGREQAARPSGLDSLTRADQEAATEEWLEARGVADAWDLAPTLVGHGLEPAALSPLAAILDGRTLTTALARLGHAIRVHGLLHEIGHASARTSEIVGALKAYSYLGQAPVQAVDLHEGIDNTLVILRHKLKDGITVHRDYAADMPRVPAFGSELNQVWTNLLDNAADAVAGNGAITIRTRRRESWAVVEIEDDGPGIPEAIQSRVFDPFFTTKPPGKGTGLGLSTSFGIITDKHRGTIAVESRPGCTRFTVRLPLDTPPTGT